MSEYFGPTVGSYPGSSVGEYAGEVGKYAGETGLKPGEVGEYDGEVGEYIIGIQVTTSGEQKTGSRNMFFKASAYRITESDILFLSAGIVWARTYGLPPRIDLDTLLAASLDF